MCFAQKSADRGYSAVIFPYRFSSGICVHGAKLVTVKQFGIQPNLFCVKNIGPEDVSFISGAAIRKMSGKTVNKTASETMMSNRRLQTAPNREAGK